ncbi:MAG: hypothetical protein AAGD34_22710 [Pseudomonadota bacterium]
MKLTFETGGKAHTLTLDPAASPNTLSHLLAALPLTADIHCAKIAGSHIMWPVPFLCRSEGGRDVLEMPPGAFFYWPERQYLEITYAPLQAETASVNYLGQLDGPVDWLKDYAETQRREQGLRPFFAHLTGPNQSPPSPHTDAPSPAFTRLADARRAAWTREPQEVADLMAREGKMMPFGPLHMAEGELRKTQELLWRLWNTPDARTAEDGVAVARFVIEAALTRVVGLCHMTKTGDALTDGLEALADTPLQDVLEELVLYTGRMAAWLDARLCFFAYNEATLRARSAWDGAHH